MIYVTANSTSHTGDASLTCLSLTCLRKGLMINGSD